MWMPPLVKIYKNPYDQTVQDACVVETMDMNLQNGVQKELKNVAMSMDIIFALIYQKVVIVS